MSWKKVIKAWGAFTDGELDTQDWGYAIYESILDAQRDYSDVRPIEIHIPEVEE